MTKTQLKKIEKEILAKLKKEPIRLIGVLKKRKEPLDIFIKTFFTKWNLNRDTIYVNTKAVQTEANKRRSLADIFMLCRYYYPECTLLDVIKVLYIKIVDTKDFRSSYCFKIQKRVWYYSKNSGTAVYNKDSKDEYGFTYNEYIKFLNENN